MVMSRTRLWTDVALSIVIGIVAPSYWNAAMAKTIPLHCTNTSSGYRWSVLVDFDHGKVDSLPAEITPQTISWYDPSDEGYYDLDTASGAMTVRHASSVGGYFLYHTCHLD